jgi:DNA repair protein RecO (recombination protein O)
MVVSGVVFYLRQGRELSLVSQAEVERQWPELRRDIVRMAYAGAAVELTDAMVSEREPDEGLFDTLESTLDRMATAPEPLLDVALWCFELSLAAALGYSPELGRCVACDGPLEAGASFAARRGGAVCGRCVGEEPGARPLSDEAASVLAGLPGTPEGDLPIAVRDEVGDTLRGFLEEHAGHELKLKSLGFLAQVRRTGRRPAEPEQDYEG